MRSCIINFGEQCKSALTFNITIINRLYAHYKQPSQHQLVCQTITCSLVFYRLSVNYSWF